MSEPIGRAPFASTHWSLVLAAGAHRSPKTDAALATLCETYWYPLYAFLRRQGYGADAAQDLTQAFFVHVLEKGVIGHANRARGRFRSFLLASLKNFAINEHERQTAKKRGGGAPVLSLEIETAEGRFLAEPSTDETPERLFDRQWALTLLDRVFTRLRDETGRGKFQQFEHLKIYLTGDSDAPRYAETALALGVSEGAVKVAVYRLRVRFREVVREEIAHTVCQPDEIDEEIRHLLASVSR